MTRQARAHVLAGHRAPQTTEGRVERSTEDAPSAPRPSAADVIAAADDFLRVAQEQQDHYDNRRPEHGDAMEDLVRERFEALRAAVRAFP